MYSFSNNKRLFIIKKKTEKLTTAVYMITGFFDDKESLKWEIRKNTLCFMSFISKLQRGGEISSVVGECTRQMEEVFTLLNLARNMRLISQMNCSVLQEEYRTLIGTLHRETEEKGTLSDFEFPDQFFADEKNMPPDTFRSVNNRTGRVDYQKKDKESNQQGVLKDNPENLYFSRENTFSPKKDFRREIIMKMLRAKGEITIKDISYLMKGVSEKTIQRELSSLVEEGAVHKEGERRWSKYILK